MNNIKNNNKGFWQGMSSWSDVVKSAEVELKSPKTYMVQWNVDIGTFNSSAHLVAYIQDSTGRMTTQEITSQAVDAVVQSISEQKDFCDLRGPYTYLQFEGVTFRHYHAPPRWTSIRNYLHGNTPCIQKG